MQSETRTRVEQLATPAGEPVVVLSFTGDIASTSQAAIMGAYQELAAEPRRLLLDFSAVDYINSSGIALVIQLLIEAQQAGRPVRIAGLSAHFSKVFTMVGIPRYAGLFADRPAALGEWK